ncbi:MAG: hypothetical protein JO140_00655 [Candidatus Eremiobacteraeota bacterium]|nr:hypothetical protein [Candidatus Eremiobacteraeota bacterium]
MEREHERETKESRKNIESENLEQTREIGTGIQGPKNAYTGTGGKSIENEFLVDNTPEGREARESDDEKARERREGGWDQTKQFLDPDSH